ncbi:hypothetical protein ES705_47344 [subsurface metagenome]
MDLQKIEKLLQKYYNGETSLEEEEVLRTFFASRDVPDHLEAEKEMFTYYYGPFKDEAPNPGLEEKILDAIRIEGSRYRMQPVKKRLYLFTSVAAGFLILLGSYFLITGKNGIEFSLKKYEDTYESPELAYLETKKTLLLISEKFNRGTKELQTLSTFDRVAKELNNISKVRYATESLYTFSLFGTGVRGLENLSKFEEAKERISKKPE